ncbi:MAG: hypothetical protein WC797_01105 [Candidatus Paceibacterota bacterium]|jgi:radical SAM enzyme (TIGR01210 family)
MKGKTVSEQLAEGLCEGHKTHGFNDLHDPSTPIDFWFQQSKEGVILFVVFYTLACRWAKCISCVLPSLGSSRYVDGEEIKKQADWFLGHRDIQPKNATINKLVISNNGSVLDRETFSPDALRYFLERALDQFPALSAISIESRPEYVELDDLSLISDILKSKKDRQVSLEIAIGLEAFDDHIRNDVLKKGLNKIALAALAKNLARHGFKLKAYVMQKPVPGMSDRDALIDVIDCARYLTDLMLQNPGLTVNMHLNPTYATNGTDLGRAFLAGQYKPPKVFDVARAVLATEQMPITIFVGTSDEGLAIRGGAFLGPDENNLRSAFETFNSTHDFSIMRSMLTKK